MAEEFHPDQVLAFWFPENSHWTCADAHRDFWIWRMQGGADDDICARFADLTQVAACGGLDHWAETPRGRLALLIALDQFPRSLWRDSPGAYAQDIKAARLALDGIENGHYDALEHAWERQFFIISIGHCEGPDHLARMEMLKDLTQASVADLPPVLAGFADTAIAQAERVHAIIARFGRHPHRNPILGRVSTPDEAAYIASGDFPHLSGLKQA
jgi:uncharacterized protein (DUF924 family)